LRGTETSPMLASAADQARKIFIRNGWESQFRETVILYVHVYVYSPVVTTLSWRNTKRRKLLLMNDLISSWLLLNFPGSCRPRAPEYARIHSWPNWLQTLIDFIQVFAAVVLHLCSGDHRNFLSTINKLTEIKYNNTYIEYCVF